MIEKLLRIRVDVHVHPQYVELRCAGSYSPSEARRVADLAYQTAATEGRRNALLDVRAVRGRVPTILERFDIGMHVAARYLETLPRIRLALLGHEPMIHPERFGAIVARNRGADTMAFTDEAEALAWLLAA